MKASTYRFVNLLLVAALVGGMAWLVPGSAEAAAVDVSVAVTGTPAPGATVTAKATITINDGSSLQSITWSQVSGATAVLSNTTTDTVTAALGNRAAYRQALIHALLSPPITDAQLPPNVPVPPGGFVGGLQNRFEVVGINPFALEEGGAVVLDVKVVTSSGTYHAEADIATALPWATTTGIRNVPINVPVVLHGKTQSSYNWVLTAPAGSTATLTDPAMQSPEFTPDVAGAYTVAVTDQAANATETLIIFAGTWKGVIVGQDANGRPKVDTACTGCHAPGTAIDMFTPWKNTGHAEIFTDNLNTSTHYSESCLVCHTVGYDPAASNNGFDDQPDFAAFIASGMLHDAQPDNWTNMLAQFPKTARLANIQCENCHGPQNSAAHMTGAGGPRQNLSSEMCGSCHGEPLRHGRYQQWQLSGHANYTLADEEGMNGTCAKCHTANGFIAWIDSNFSESSLQITWTADQIHPQTCQACHDPHAIGTTSGSPASNATVRISGDTPMLPAGFVASGVGRGAVCMTCHNSRRGLRNDDTFAVSSAAQAPHVGTQADMVMGQNLYFVQTGERGVHSHVTDTCVGCHMGATPPPDLLSYDQGGTNHTFYASKDICSKCHNSITAETVQGPVEAKLASLQQAIGQGILAVMQTQIQKGATIDLGGLATVTNVAQVSGIQVLDSHGQQGITVTMADNTVIGPVTMGSVKVVPAAGSAVPLWNVADPSLPKATWNLLVVETDGSTGVHNPSFITSALDVALFAVKNANPNPSGGFVNPANNGGPGNGAGAVSCTSPFVYWAEIVARNEGEAGSVWRTDLVARNLVSSNAAVKFVLHAPSGETSATSTIAGGSQGVYQDVVGMMNMTDAKGSLEICSDQPLQVLGRIFQAGEDGTYGQFIDGHVANLGLATGQTASLLGLRQETGKFRTNISVTNGGATAAQVSIALYATDGTALTTYTLSLAPGQVYQDLAPFEARANKPDLGFGFATVTVLSGDNVLTSGVGHRHDLERSDHHPDEAVEPLRHG